MADELADVRREREIRELQSQLDKLWSAKPPRDVAQIQTLWNQMADLILTRPSGQL